MSQSPMHDCTAEAMHGWNRACYLLTVCRSSALSSLLSAEVLLSLSGVTAPSGTTEGAWQQGANEALPVAWMRGAFNLRPQGREVSRDLEDMLFLRRPSMMLLLAWFTAVYSL